MESFIYFLEQITTFHIRISVFIQYICFNCDMMRKYDSITANMINIYRKIKMTLENIPDDPMIPPTCPLEVPGSSPMMIPAGLGFGGGGLGFSFGLGGRTSI